MRGDRWGAGAKQRLAALTHQLDQRARGFDHVLGRAGLASPQKFSHRIGEFVHSAHTDLAGALLEALEDRSHAWAAGLLQPLPKHDAVFLELRRGIQQQQTVLRRADLEPIAHRFGRLPKIRAQSTRLASHPVQLVEQDVGLEWLHVDRLDLQRRVAQDFLPLRVAGVNDDRQLTEQRQAADLCHEVPADLTTQMTVENDKIDENVAEQQFERALNTVAQQHVVPRVAIDLLHQTLTQAVVFDRKHQAHGRNGLKLARCVRELRGAPAQRGEGARHDVPLFGTPGINFTVRPGPNGPRPQAPPSWDGRLIRPAEERPGAMGVRSAA